MRNLPVKTTQHTEFVEITDSCQEAVDEAASRRHLRGRIPHTTAGNNRKRNADPDVVTDMIFALEQAVPWKVSKVSAWGRKYGAHVKIQHDGAQTPRCSSSTARSQLGTWQGVFLCEFDGRGHARFGYGQAVGTN